MYEELYSNVTVKLNNLLKPNDVTIIYQLNQELINKGNYEYYVDVYNNHGTTYELSIIKIQADGEIYGDIRDLGEDWKVYPFDLPNIFDKLTIIQILEEQTKK